MRRLSRTALWRIVLCIVGACALAASQAAVASAVSGSVMAAGEGGWGQLGNGTDNDESLLTPVSGLSDVTSVDGHRNGGLALLSDGTVMAWGRNDMGQLGNGTSESSFVPVPVSGLTEVTAISAYGKSCLALLANGTVVAWGENNHGQLGDGTTENRSTPIPVSGLSGVVAIAAGEAHSLALLSDGEVVSWGSNVHGQLGNGSSEDSHVPVPVTGLSGIVAIAAGGEHSLALTSGGTVFAWGNGKLGQLGNGAATDSPTPVPVNGLTSGVTAISAGSFFSLALLSDGTVKSWGDDTYGQLGNGNSGKGMFSSTPIAVMGLSEATAISAGEYSSLALLASKRVAAWGGDEFGQLAIGEAFAGAKSAKPVLMCGLIEAGGISAGNLANFVYGVTSTLACPAVESVSPKSGPLAGGQSVTITGSGFGGASAVHFGTAEASSFTVESPTTITAVTPAGSGFVEPTVTTAAGTSPRSVEYAYVGKPSVEKIKPHKGPASGGTTVTISASGFGGPNTPLQEVKFGALKAASFKLVTAKGHTTLTAVSPAGLEAGTVYVTVATPGGASAPGAKTDAFKVVPLISSVSPSSGSKAGGTSVVVSGAGFAVGTGLTAFKFGAGKATSVKCPSTTECSMIAPAHAAGVVDLKATANGASSTKNAPADQYSYS
jgi:alpha-tubulin suppressor-like RCC1 family protein